MIDPVTSEQSLSQVWSLLGCVPDPEIPVLSVLDLGIVRDVRRHVDGFEVAITPTYSGCPAMDTIEQDIVTYLAEAGISPVTITRVLSPAWTSDWLTPEGREKLRKFGIAPPSQTNHKKSLLGDATRVQCPRCQSHDTQLISEFGSTPCKSHHRCGNCLEPFDCFKCI